VRSGVWQFPAQVRLPMGESLFQLQQCQIASAVMINAPGHFHAFISALAFHFQRHHRGQDLEVELLFRRTGRDWEVPCSR
jgi:hypothetical protein